MAWANRLWTLFWRERYSLSQYDHPMVVLNICACTYIKDTFNHCFGSEENYPTLGEKVEVVERRFGERQFLPVVKGFDVVDKTTSMFKWKAIKSTTRCRCQYCPHEGWFARADLTVLSDHAWKCHFSPNYPPMCPFTCSVCGFGSVRVEEVCKLCVYLNMLVFKFARSVLYIAPVILHLISGGRPHFVGTPGGRRRGSFPRHLHLVQL